MIKITLQQVQQNIGDIANRHEYTTDVIYELLAAYGRSKSAITQLREGHLNKAEDENAVLQKDVVYFKTFPAGAQLEHEVIKLYEDPLTQRYSPRYLIATDLVDVAIKDNLIGTQKFFKLADIDNHLELLYGWTGDEITKPGEDTPANRQAAEKMNELYLEIEKQNRLEFTTNPAFRHELNTFFTRLLFCYFAEDTGIYDNGQFTSAIKTYTQTDGSDLTWFFGELFSALDTKPDDNHTLKSPFKEFPYVNGSIFNTTKHSIAIPKFSAQARHLIIECGRQNWGKIDPDIFGTIFQGVVDPEHRDENGMDYTSVPNIMKVIKPLFLDSLHEQFDKYYDNEKKLWALLGRIQKIKVFDPACGSGNFLIIAYKELRQLQHAIIGRIDELMPTGIGVKIPDNQLININNFYGIEIDDFAHELAVLSLFLAKHQMNQEFTEQFGKVLSIIPLIDIPTIKHGNAARLDWQEICPNVEHAVTKAEQEALFDFGEPEQISLVEDEKIYDEIYLIGNPPYKGARWFSAEQKQDTVKVLGDIKGFGNLDYISIWFVKGADYIRGTKAELAFVTTNSISQGVSVDILWPLLLEGLEINFAHQSFKWTNSARDQAGVTVAVISLRSPSKKAKLLYAEGIEHQVDNINAYLLDADNIFIKPASKPISNIQALDYGSFALDDGNFTISEDEYSDLIAADSRAEKFLKPFIGAAEFLRGINRWAVWITADEADEAKQIPVLKAKIDKVFEWRDKSSRTNTKKLAAIPWRFAEIRYQERDCIISPIVSSERRAYIPMGYLPKGTIVSNAAFAIYDAELWLFSLLESKMHMAWIRTVCGKLKTDYRYSSTLGYNTFPIKPLTEAEKEALNKSARHILLARAAHPEKTLADMYDPDKMPADLREAHDENDHLVDSLYRKGGFTKDEDRLAALFELYEQMTEKEKTK
ncbi:MAG TPA: N-6 DNA methylase [Candidatus Saccharibacteria bacterium]|nr:N-6 DNA methylase [Candidatus Saccharibacteria bacterium]HMR38776.1 N-6 DNA methylase [Candidatus Saccharibacteria bacterium]HMR72493.1 N-6 DNA methylase [Candidatus Saccharibacteria bacterium]